MTDATPPVLAIAGASRVYGSGPERLEIFRDLDLSVRRGEIVGLIGPSGSGKSSLLHIAGLLEKPDAGDVAIEGRSTGKLGDAERSAIRRGVIGFVYQFHFLLPEFTALENVIIPQQIAKTSARAAKDRARALLTSVGLAERVAHQPGQLSGGEQQRVAIARALANRPRLLIADEPTGNLDPVTAAGVFDALGRLAREEGVSVLCATHNLDLARYMDRVLALRGGRVVDVTAEISAKRAVI